MAEHCFVASAFTRRTLVENGVHPDRVTVIPYGVDLERFQPPAAPPLGPLRVLFVGQMVQRKGLRYLLEAWKRAALPDAELVLAGRGRMDDELLAQYAGLFRLERDAGPDRLRELYQESDICCVPSLAEGFGLVYLESLACGTPVIGTDNTGAADLVRDGQEGFVVPIRDTDALVDRLRWCHANRDELAAMRTLARRRAEEHSWPAFRRALVAGLRALDTGAHPG
nr:glycosyltransferase family 4 protein [Longimicrobium terrae]